MIDTMHPSHMYKQIRMPKHSKSSYLSSAVFWTASMAVLVSQIGLGQNIVRQSGFPPLSENDLQKEIKETSVSIAEPNTLIGKTSEMPAVMNGQENPADVKHVLKSAGTPELTVQRQLRQARISASILSSPDPTKEEIEGLIRRIRSIEIRPKHSEPAVSASSAPQAEEPAAKPEDQELPQAADSNPAKTAAADGTISTQTLELFRQYAQQPSELKNPYELGEILYKGKCLKEAAICYKEAIKRLKDQPNAAEDRSWMLLRLGDCLRADNPAEALEIYRMLIQEYPNSPWTMLAKSKSMLAEWYLQAQPRKLIDQSALSTAEGINLK